MKRILLFFVFITLCTVASRAQKVGLVLSGGAAKGIAHVGVLKALEENEIPVDYIVGTSMGGIIGGCYAAGMSPDEIEEMILSDEFLRWVNGASETGFNYFYHKRDISPGFLTVTLALDSTLNLQLNSSLASDVSLNFALTEKMAQASAIAKENFDSLFVPLRVVTSDIFTQNEVVLSKGSLGEALRATQSVPFFYSPIRIDGKYLFDGGVYNNFPVDVAQRDFNPDVVIGVNVSTKIFEEYPYENDEKLISKSLLFMLLDKSDPSLIPDHGIFIQPNLRGFTSFDFGRAKSLIDSGYVQTMRQMDEIRQKVQRRMSCDTVSSLRNEFRNKSLPFTFGRLSFQGFNAKQRGYIRGTFKANRNYGGVLTYSQIKKGYFRLVSEDYFMNVYPKIFYDSTSRLFRLQLTRRPQQNFLLDFGGVVASRDISNIYLGVNYYWFNHLLGHAFFGVQSGNFYKSGVGKVRFDLPLPFYVEPYLGFDNWDYLESDDLLKEVTRVHSPTVLQRIQRKSGVKVGVPLKHALKANAFIEGYNNTDRYINGRVFVSTDTLDKLSISGFRTGIEITSNTLNRKQYASAGKSFSLSGQYFRADAHLAPGNTSVLRENSSKMYQWFRLKLSVEQYLGHGWFKPGYYIEAVTSNQPSFQNYTGTVINAPAFLPLQDSRTLLLQNFRSFNYVAGGLRNVLTLKKKIDLRVEAYAFKPFDLLQESSKQETLVTTRFDKIFFAGSTALIYHSPIGPLSLSFNYYDDRENRTGLLLHVGYLLFQNHSLE
jgi:NTE family protein